jgi:hypothetical protein
MSQSMMPAYIAERIRRQPPEGCGVVPGSTPVIAFGDVRTARVATLGLNPSKSEFLNRHGHELTRAHRRLATLASLGIDSLEHAPDAVVAEVLAGCTGYFQRNPYRRWFDQLQRILNSLGVSYYDGSAAHLDLVQWATNPVWRHLSPPTRVRLLRDDAVFLRQQLENEQIAVLLLNGRSVIAQLQHAFGIPLAVSQRIASGRLTTELVTGVLGRCAIIGWSTNLQSSFGVTRVLREQLANVVGMLVENTRGEMVQIASDLDG